MADAEDTEKGPVTWREDGTALLELACPVNCIVATEADADRRLVKQLEIRWPRGKDLIALDGVTGDPRLVAMAERCCRPFGAADWGMRREDLGEMHVHDLLQLDDVFAGFTERSRATGATSSVS